MVAASLSVEITGFLVGAVASATAKHGLVAELASQQLLPSEMPPRKGYTGVDRAGRRGGGSLLSRDQPAQGRLNNSRNPIFFAKMSGKFPAASEIARRVGRLPFFLDELPGVFQRFFLFPRACEYCCC